MKKNPFKFGSVVEAPYFTNRTEEQGKLNSLLHSDNPIIMMSPRRYGKTSLVFKVVKDIGHKYILLDLQLITTVSDLAGQLLQRVYRVFPFERIKQFIKKFRIIPSVTINPLNNEVEISFNPDMAKAAIEDVLNLLNRLGNKSNKLIVIFDEFQEIKRIDQELDRLLRSIMQYHQNVSYVFLGSQESLIKGIFEQKKSPFYHFGYLFPLHKIPYPDFFSFLTGHFKTLVKNYELIAESILAITNSHPYYTQQLAFTIWEILQKNNQEKEPINKAVMELINMHDMDYERIWNILNRTDRVILIGMAFSDSSPLSVEFSKKYNTGAQSTVFSALKRLMQMGYINKTNTGYEIDDPFYKLWIKERRQK